jgi:hypothetical protein
MRQPAETPMPDISAIAAVVNSLNAAVSIAKAMKDLKEWSDVQSKVIELQTVILDAQAGLFAANTESLTQNFTWRTWALAR